MVTAIVERLIHHISRALCLVGSHYLPVMSPKRAAQVQKTLTRLESC